MSVSTDILTAQLKIANMVDLNITAMTGGNTSVNWHPTIKATRGVNVVSNRLGLGDTSSPIFQAAYACMMAFVGNYGAGTIDPNAQNPGTTINVTTVVQAQANYTRIEFVGVDTVSLSNFQATYALIYGDNAIVEVFVTTDNYATMQQDTGTVPTIVNLGGDINKPDSYTWAWGIPTTGYIQITGFKPQGGNTSAGLPITNSGSAFLSNAQLNTLYPTALWGQYILVPAINTQYIKLDNSPTGLWSYEPYNPNT